MNIYGNQFPYRSPQAPYKNKQNEDINQERNAFYNEYDPMKILRHAGGKEIVYLYDKIIKYKCTI